MSCSYSDISCKRTKAAPLQERRMIDQFRLWAKGGDGGNGCSCFRRSRYDRRGRPDGGNGGRGGDVILECSTAFWDFSSLQHHVNAKRGGHGAPKNMIGSRGSDKVMLIPVGTVIHLLNGELPSCVEKKSTGALDPWDILGTVEFCSSESSQQSTSDMDNANEGKTISSKETLKERASTLPFKVRDKSRNEHKDDSFPKPQQGYIEREDLVLKQPSLEQNARKIRKRQNKYNTVLLN